MDVAFIVLLVATSLNGLALLVLRETSACGLLLVVHLAVVMALFLTLPYGKFVHGIYRSAALMRYALDESRPVPTGRLRMPHSSIQKANFLRPALTRRNPPEFRPLTDIHEPRRINAT